jgi:hypothetical protein
MGPSFASLIHNTTDKYVQPYLIPYIIFLSMQFFIYYYPYF